MGKRIVQILENSQVGRVPAIHSRPWDSEGTIMIVSLRRILFPTDFSDPAKEAQQYACTLAEKFDAQLHACWQRFKMAARGNRRGG
jgi:hypothetical protein